MKIYPKSECKLVNGYIVHGEDIVGIDNEIVDLFNKLETDIQRREFDIENPIEVAERKQFVRKSERRVGTPRISARTPNLDKAVEEGIELMKELDAVDNAECINHYIDGIDPVVQFCKDDFVVDCNQSQQHRFDLPVIGNPLEVDADDLLWLVGAVFIMDAEDLEDDEDVESE